MYIFTQMMNEKALTTHENIKPVNKNKTVF